MVYYIREIQKVRRDSFSKNTSFPKNIYFLGQPDFLFLKGLDKLVVPKNTFFGKEKGTKERK
jgi:hypothetical protein